MKNSSGLIFIPFLVLGSHAVFAGGYATDVPSAAAMGNSYSGQASGMHNISDMFVNPAILMSYSRNQINIDGNYIAPDLVIGPNATARTSAGLGNQNIDLEGDGSEGTHGDKNAFVPMLYGMLDINPNLRVGMGINVPFGLSTSYPEQWIGRYKALDSEIQAINLSPTIAYKFNQDIAFAASLQVQYLESNLSTAIDFGSLLIGSPNYAFDGKSEITADDWGYGFKLGVLFTPNQFTKFGIGYRSKIDHTLSGENDFTVPASAAVITSTGQFVDTDITADLITPETLNFGISHQLTTNLNILMDAAWTHWSRMDTLTIEHENPLQADAVTNFKWNNSWFWGVGANYKYNDTWLLRTGFAYEQSPVNSTYLSPRVPLNDKYFASLGFNYLLSSCAQIDVSYIHEFFKDAHSDLNFDDPNNTFSGSLNADYEVGLDAIAASLSYQF
ncbi:MAG: OmpP1/FadL family transporter [Pseudomonadota bacterium]